MLTVSSRKVVRDSVRGISEFDYAMIVLSEGQMAAMTDQS